MTYDVIVAGAGISGLAAAWRLAAKQKRVLLIEARDRIGGRMARREVPGDGWIDLGGQWVGSQQASIWRYVKELGVKEFKQYVKGAQILSYQGNTARAGDFIVPAPSEVAAKAAYELGRKLDNLAESSKVTANPWESEKAHIHDRMTFQQWIIENSLDEYARFYVDWNSRFSQSGGSSWEVPLLHSLFETSVNPHAEDPEEFLLIGGAGQIPGLVMNQLKPLDVKLVLGSKVVAVKQGASVTVTTRTSSGENASYEAAFAIMAMPPFLTAAIDYDPPLPAQRLQLIQRMPMGTIAKVACIYKTAWWRAKELSGLALGDEHRTVQSVCDSGRDDTPEPGILTCFIQGDKYIHWSMRDGPERRKLVTDDLVTYFGEAAGVDHQIDYVEANWPADPLTGGAYNAYMAPGAWTAYGPSLRTPHDRIYWAGTEMATKWYGYFDGAISAGETAADQILAQLG